MNVLGKSLKAVLTSYYINYNSLCKISKYNIFDKVFSLFSSLRYIISNIFCTFAN